MFLNLLLSSLGYICSIKGFKSEITLGTVVFNPNQLHKLVDCNIALALDFVQG